MDRLEKLREDKFLTCRMFSKLSENMHYEILKYLNSLHLLQIKSCTLGGYQVTSNNILRSRIKNYIKVKKFNIGDMKPTELNNLRLRIIFEQTGNSIFDLEGILLDMKGISNLITILKLNSRIIDGIKIGI